MADLSYPQSLNEMREKGKEENDTSQAPTPTSASATFTHPVDLEAQLSNLDSNPCSARRHDWTAYLNQEIPHDRYLEVQLLMLSFATGVMDAIAFATYGVFVTKQTGNTVFLTLSALNHSSMDQTAPNIAVSFFLFVAGATIFGHLSHTLGQNRRAWLLLSNTIQSALVFTAAALRHWTPIKSQGPNALGIIAMLSFAFGGQISMAFCLKVPDLNTTMVTGAIVQLATDRSLFARRNPPRDRKVAFFLFLLAGAFVGSAVAKRVYASIGILIVALAKTAVTAMFLFGGTRFARWG